MKAQEKMDQIIQHINKGRTVVISTCTRAAKIDTKVINRFKNVGRELFKVDGNSLYMSRGKHYDCIDYAKINVYEEVSN